ncbi:MAG TPA: alanine--tRNA ligase [Candidatus Saccharimonadales bacterium]|nr:alanine--tRNA ligase [Candidatus Saccharimonadales bacterium]
MNASEIRQKYLDFFKAKDHTIIPRANLVPQDDPTTLFTGSGMQPLLPYLLGQKHPSGTRLVNSQTCFRAEDIDEVGDNRHTTFFEMLGNWSLGEYFKAEQLPWLFEFLTDVVGLDPTKLYVTALIGDDTYKIPRDTESVETWTKLFKDKGIDPKVAEMGSEADSYNRGIKPDERIFLYDVKKNWWNRGEKGPRTTPVGDPCGPSAEVFYLFDGIEHDAKWGMHCHPNCDCGRFLEIANSVFMQYVKTKDDGLVDLPHKNVDFGGGLERIAAAALDNSDVFKISLMWPIIEKLEQISGKKYQDHVEAKRIIADHMRSAVFMACDGVMPSNTGQGYVLRRLLRRAIRRGHELGIEQGLIREVAPVVANLYRDAYPEVIKHEDKVIRILEHEEKVFRQTLRKGLREFDKLRLEFLHYGSEKDGSEVEGPLLLTGELIFKLFDTYGFPPELSAEEAGKRDIQLADDWRENFDQLMTEQRERSRTATKGVFKGGLTDQSDKTIKYHTATHMLYKALRTVLGDDVEQRGSNITPERTRFDFSHHGKVTPEQQREVEKIVNDAIKADLPVTFKEMPTKEALDMGARGHFGEKYGDTVKVYTIGDPAKPYSMELCGGPHVEHTGVLGHFKIIKEEASSAGVRRIKAILE